MVTSFEHFTLRGRNLFARAIGADALSAAPAERGPFEVDENGVAPLKWLCAREKKYVWSWSDPGDCQTHTVFSDSSGCIWAALAWFANLIACYTSGVHPSHGSFGYCLR